MASGLAAGLDLRPPASLCLGPGPGGGRDGSGHQPRPLVVSWQAGWTGGLFQWLPKAESMNTLHLSLGSSPASEFPGVSAALVFVVPGHRIHTRIVLREPCRS